MGLSALELAGICIYSPSEEEITGAIENCLGSEDLGVIAECLHGMGHLARRFKRFDADLFERVCERGRAMSRYLHVQHAWHDMVNDVEFFMPSKVLPRPLQ